ncbi:MAG: diacylglycerol kinase family protein [Hyphomicrobiales bacterium]
MAGPSNLLALMTTGLIINPAAGGKNLKGLKLARLVAGKADVKLAILDDFAGLSRILEEFAGAEVKTLFISAGDGTAQAIQTLIAEEKPFETQPPRLALLSHGTTNMTAAELGFQYRSLQRIADMITHPACLRHATAIKRRATLRIVNPRNTPPQHGMFLGAGALWRGAVACQKLTGGTPIDGRFSAPALILAKALVGVLFFKPTTSGGGTRIDFPCPMTIAIDKTPWVDGDQLLFLATTLNRLVLRARPFWGGERAKPGAIRATAIASPPPAIARHALSVLYGGEERGLPDGYFSMRAQHISLEQNDPFIVDGQYFEAPHDGPLIIEQGYEFEYLCG